MTLFIVILFCFILIFIYFYLLKNTIFGINLKAGEYVGFFLFYNLIVFVIPSSVLLNLFPIETFWVAFKVNQDSIFLITLLILVSMFLFFTSLKIFAVIDIKYTVLQSYKKNINREHVKYFLRITVMILLLIILFVWFILGIGHSFSIAIINNISVSDVRLDIENSSSIIVKILKHLFILIVPFLVSMLGSNVYKLTSIEHLFLFVSILFIASWAGSKSPFLTIFIVYVISYLTFNNMKISLKLIFKFLIGSLILMYFVYNVVLLQYKEMANLDLFFDYFIQRVFVAQMIGTYEQFNLFIRDFSYISHGIPFASFFTDYPIFQKDLMMISEDRIDPSSIGIKNTFFISEAYAMGGWILVCLSPIWMSINLALSYIIIVFIMDKFIFDNLEYSKRVVAIALFSYISITGGFSDLIFFKITILILILILPFLIIFYSFKILYYKKLTYTGGK